MALGRARTRRRCCSRTAGAATPRRCARFVFPLLQAGYRVIAYDQPAHGVSEGKLTGLPDFADVLGAVARHHGGIEAVIAHSLGGAGAALALAWGKASFRKIVLVSPPSDLVGYSRRFARWYWMPEPVRKAMQNAIEERYGVRWEELEVAQRRAAPGGAALVIHDRDDRMMPWTHGAKVARVLARRAADADRRPRPWPHPARRARDAAPRRVHPRDEANASEVKWDDPIQLAQAGTLHGRHRIPARDPRRPAAAAADLRAARLTRLAEVEPGHAVFEITAGERHYNPIGVVHGGLAMTLLDSAMGCAVQTQMPAGGGYTTLEAKTNLVRAITVGNRPAARHRQGRARRQARGDRRSAARRPVGQALRARHDHVHRSVSSLWREHLLPQLA